MPDFAILFYGIRFSKNKSSLFNANANPKPKIINANLIPSNKYQEHLSAIRERRDSQTLSKFKSVPAGPRTTVSANLAAVL